MCGRYTLTTPGAALVEAFDVPDLAFDYAPRYNIAPGQSAAVVAEDGKGRRLGPMTWGLIPAWKDPPKRPLINARSESVETKPSFREAFARRRCLIPADGFYEWKRMPDGSKSPHWIHPVADGPIAFAGVWEAWTRLGVADYGFAILTTEANADVRAVHDRMPVVIHPDAYGVWLRRETASNDLRALLKAPLEGTFRCRPVSRRVNRTSEDDAGLLERSES